MQEIIKLLEQEIKEVVDMQYRRLWNVLGLMVVTGCAHPGVVNIVRSAQRSLKKEKIYLVLGGFHLLAYSEPQVRRIIRDLKAIGVEKVGPSHCTGGRPIELFKEAWGENFFDLGCGARLDIP